MTLHEEIQERCDAFASDIAVLIQNSLFGLLGVKSATPRPASVSGRVAMPKGAKRSPEALALTVEQLFQHVKSFGHDGARIEQLSESLNVPTSELVLPMRKLIGARRVRKTGQKRATTYYAR